MQIKDFDSAVILLNAYRNQIYVQHFLKDGTSQKPVLIDTDSISNYLNNMSGKIICTGSGLKETYEQIKNIDNLTILPRFPVIRAIHIARYADQKIKSKIFDPITPLYIRPPDAVPQI